MYLCRSASTVLNCGFGDGGSSQPWCCELMHLAILPLLVRVEAEWGWDWSHKIKSSELCVPKPSHSCELVNAKPLSAWSQNCGPNCEPWERSTNPKPCPGLLLPWLDAQLDVRPHPKHKEMFKSIKCLSPEMCLGGCEPPSEGLVLV